MGRFQLIVYFTLFHYTATEVFTSIASLKSLVSTEASFLIPLERYITSEEKRLDKLRIFMNKIIDKQEKVKKHGVDNFLGNPLNSYLLIRRINYDWKDIRNNLTKESTESQELAAVIDNFQLVSIEDREGAMSAILRLQKMYQISSQNLAEGDIPGVPDALRESLDVIQMFEIGRYAYNTQKWSYAVQWLQIVFKRMESSTNTDGWCCGVDKFQVLDLLAFSKSKVGDLRTAIIMTETLLKWRPGDNQLVFNMKFYQDELKKQDSHAFKVNNASTEKSSVDDTNSGKTYEMLCRGDKRTQSSEEIKQMRCWYNQNDPVLMLKPQKIERIWTSPELFQFHDIITEEEISLIKNTAYPKLHRSGMLSGEDGSLTPRKDETRISKTAWLYPEHYDFVRKMSIRVEAVTGLDMKSAEPLQALNYGLGGHYEPHYDYAEIWNIEKLVPTHLGNRIATLLIYLSNVEAGGATAFANGNAAVFPKKGAAIFWYNLKKNGEGETMTMHAGCPVLVGQKWISNWWIRERGQEFRRPCSLDRYE